MGWILAGLVVFVLLFGLFALALCKMAASMDDGPSGDGLDHEADWPLK